MLTVELIFGEIVIFFFCSIFTIKFVWAVNSVLTHGSVLQLLFKLCSVVSKGLISVIPLYIKGLFGLRSLYDNNIFSIALLLFVFLGSSLSS